jgi:hypothetical protein
MAQAQPAPEPKAPESDKLKKLADFNYDEEAFAAHVAEVAAEKAAAKLAERQAREQKESSRKNDQSKFRASEAKLRE